MSNPTTPFSWQMPTATDLVTDLPADFEVFGQAVATSMADLLGGTSGQILAKNSNTDMDFVWTTPNPGDITGVTAGVGISGGGTSGDVTITNSMATEITAKGDLIVGTGSATFDNLAAGANGSTIVADSSTSTGLRWQAPVQANPVINSNFSVWQRGTSVSYSASGTPYGPDRFTIYSGNTGTCSRQTTSDTTNLPFIQYSARTQRTAGQTSTNAFYFGQSFENINSTPFVGKTVTFSYYARKGANYSGTGLTAYFKQSTGTDQNYVTGAMTGETVLSALDINSTITTTWQRFTSTFTVTTAATQIGFYFDWRPSGTAGANDWFEVTGIQLEVGSVATPYKPTGATFQGELAACQRYFFAYTSPSSVSFYGNGQCTSTTKAYSVLPLPVTMRTTPTLTAPAATNFAVANSVDSDVALTAIALRYSSLNSAEMNCTTASGLVAGNATRLYGTSSSAYLQFSAEL